MVNETTTQTDFDAFLKTVSGHIGFGSIMNNPKTSYDIANNPHAVDLILGNSGAVDSLLNTEIGLKAFTENGVSSRKIFREDDIFKQLRKSIIFNQKEGPTKLENTYEKLEKVGDFYFLGAYGASTIYKSTDLINWDEISFPNDSTGNSFSANIISYRGDNIAYDKLNKAYFFISTRSF